MDDGAISARVMPGRVDGRQIDAGVRAGFVETGLVMVGERRTVTGLCRPTAQAGEGARRVRLVPRPQPAARRRRDAQASGGAVDTTPAAEKAPSVADSAAPT